MSNRNNQIYIYDPLTLRYFNKNEPEKKPKNTINKILIISLIIGIIVAIVVSVTIIVVKIFLNEKHPTHGSTLKL